MKRSANQMRSDGWLQGLARQHPLTSFFVLAYVFAWLCYLPPILTSTGLGIIHANVPIKLFLEVGAWSPTVAALCIQWLTERNFKICCLHTSWKRALLGSLMGLALAMFAIVVLPAFALSKASPLALHWSEFVTISTWGAYLSSFVTGPINEEPGWRGFALPRMQARFGPLAASLLLGLLWAVWHFPLFVIRSWAAVPMWAFSAYVIAVSVLIAWGMNSSGFSIIAPVLMHATSNSSPPLMEKLFQGLPMRQHDTAIYLGVVVGVALAVILLTKGKLGLGNLRACT
ncbi:MAG TPA: CPBP family intramembrane glutamic endopeptidase [Candidatus Angelobacter sp.]|nr:CPBP family intramembrane glutamic endopeptidase [Candidatus Angelobacter sp.]